MFFLTETGLEIDTKECKCIHFEGNPIQERHIFIYTESKRIRLDRQANGVLKTINGSGWENETYDIICTIDNSKDFHEQNDDVYLKILNYFNSLK